MNSCACISYRSKKRCLQACTYATAICVKLNVGAHITYEAQILADF